MSEMFELGALVGQGAFSMFCRLRGYPSLGVLVPKDVCGIVAKQYLEQELRRAKILANLKINVPKYVGVFLIKVPDYFDKTLMNGLEKKDPRSISLEDKFINYDLLKHFTGKTVYGLVMEHIEKDLSLISANRLKYIYKKEREKIESYGIILGEDADNNVLWSQKEGKLYFIDFEKWDLSNMHERIEKKAA
jgi:hypothetical protein